jgi:subtilase family serine protease
VRLWVEELESRTLLSSSGLESILAEPAVAFSPQVTNSYVIGLTPAQVRHAYGFDLIAFAGGRVAGDGTGQTIAIVDAYDNPTIASDLQLFDRTFGLPDPVFTKATPQGRPQASAIWGLESALDVEWAHAIAPRAKILLVEAASAGLGNLLGAVNYARSQPGVVAVSMSWGTAEFSSETYFDSYFTTLGGHLGGSGLPGGITFVASAGDAGASSGALWPSSSSNVTSVGGTRLYLNGTGAYRSETTWANGGGSTSRYETEPRYQYGFQSSSRRSTPDIAYNADPASGFAVYDSYGYHGQSGWFQVGGTSAGAPQWAALMAIADQGRALAGKSLLSGAPSTVYTLPASDFHDITSGSNGYAALPGYDLATGRGSPFAQRVVNDLVGSKGSTKSVPTPPPSYPNQSTGLLSSALIQMDRAGGRPLSNSPLLSRRGLSWASEAVVAASTQVEPADLSVVVPTADASTRIQEADSVTVFNAFGSTADMFDSAREATTDQGLTNTLFSLSNGLTMDMVAFSQD